MVLLVVFLFCAGFGYWAARRMPVADRIHRALIYGMAGGLVVLVVFAITGGLTA